MRNIKVYMLLMICLLMVIIMVGCGSKTHEETMLDIYKKEGYDKAREYIDTVDDPIEKIDLVFELGAKDAGMTREEFEKVLSDYDNEENIYKKVEVVEHDIKNNSPTSKTLKTTLKNNTGKTLKYVKIDIFYYDDKGNLKDTEWANKSGTFLDGGEFIIETYITLPDGATKYDVEVSEVSIK